ncbi:hypothetical protein [Sulfurimonas sp.]
MRGSVYYQTAQLTKVIFKEGIKKEQRINPKYPYYQCVTSYKTMETYRSVWNNFGHYLKEHWNIKDFEQVTSEHVEAYFEYKIEYYPSKQYLEKLSSALGKLEIALNKFSMQKYTQGVEYNFDARQQKLNNARKLKHVADGYHNRVYYMPDSIINNLISDKHKLAARIQLEGGARCEGVAFIKKNQLMGIKIDKITNQKVGILSTKEKGGKVGDIFLNITTYQALIQYLDIYGNFKLDYQKYANDIRNACSILNIKTEGTHGFRWTFAQNRVRAYQEAGYSYEQSLQGVSWEMKHYRASITEHYCA